MLDERLLGLTFQLPDAQSAGGVSFLGVLYHYRGAGPAETGLLVVVTEVSPLYLTVTGQHNVLEY